jgi:hypothetical protein
MRLPFSQVYGMVNGLQPFMEAARGQRAWPNPFAGIRQAREGITEMVRGGRQVWGNLPTARGLAESAIAYGRQRLPELAANEGMNLLNRAMGGESPTQAVRGIGEAYNQGGAGEGIGRLMQYGERAVEGLRNRVPALPGEEAHRFLQHQYQQNPGLQGGVDIMKQGWNHLTGAAENILPYVGAAAALGMAGRMAYNKVRARRNRQRNVERG